MAHRGSLRLLDLWDRLAIRARHLSGLEQRPIDLVEFVLGVGHRRADVGLARHLGKRAFLFLPIPVGQRIGPLRSR
jgi:hypothetical protein